MSRVEINAGGRQVVVDHTGELEHLRTTALMLWQATDSPEPSPGAAVGFAAERRGSHTVEPVGNGQYGSPTGPVHAEAS